MWRSCAPGCGRYPTFPSLSWATSRTGAMRSTSLRQGPTLTCPNRLIVWSWWPGCAPCCAAPGDRIPLRQGEARGVDIPMRSARRGDGRGGLTSTEFRLLSCLRLNEGSLVPYPQLMAEVWGDREVSRDCLKFYVRRLRQKLGRALGSAGFILNHSGVGYRFSRTM